MEIIKYISEGERPIELLKLIVTAATAYLTVTWSLKKFLKEKRWERESEAYTRIIEALHHIKRVVLEFQNEGSEVFEGQLVRKQLAKEKIKALAERHNKAKQELEKYADMGAYCITHEAIEAIERLFKVQNECQVDFDAGADEEDLYETELKATEKCLKTILDIAIKEVNK